MTIGQRLRAARDAARLTQDAVDRAAGVPATTTSKIERGERGSPRIGTLESLASAVGASVAWLITGEGEAPPGVAAEPEAETPVEAP